MKAYFDAYPLTGYVALPAAFLCFAAMILAIKAWTWKIYRYDVKASATAAK
jgi:hypothetical protein